ncbi:MAG: lipopolysaccharide transport periplasmic protein LptA [Chromatiales bacterium]|nr:lipopolysaccharide transport periplasmic protein LptA [Chromatiales bacterium]
MNPQNKKVLPLLLALLWSPGLALALNSDRTQPIEIESDRAEIDEGKNTATYTGNVVVVQGSLRIQSDRLVVHGLRTADRIVAKGKPARFRQTPDGGKADVLGDALTLEYELGKDHIKLTEQANLTQRGNTFSGHIIDYDLNKDQVRAQSDQNRSQRVRVTMQPRQAEGSNDTRP